MEINITRFVNEACPKDYSASVAEIGDNAGRITWNHAIEDSAEFFFLDNDDKRQAFREFVNNSGGWTEDEIKAWSDVELNALFIQWVSGDLREAGIIENTPEEWEQYRKESEKGIVCSNLFKSDDGQVYFDFGM